MPSMKFALSILFLACVFVSSDSLADIEGIAVWKPDPNGVAYVVPRIKGESPSVTYARWQKQLKVSPTYRRMENVQLVHLETAPETFSSVPVAKADQANVAVVLNRPNQMVRNNPYMQAVTASFEKEGNRLFAIPVGLELTLTPRQHAQFRERLNDFDGQLGVGGDDPHPLTYGQRTIARTEGDISFERDIVQSKYMTEYIRNGKGRVFYICGSMQRCAVADGWKMHDDISTLTKAVHRSTESIAMLEVVATPGSELAIAAGSTRFQTSNAHHAAVNASSFQENKRPKSIITAYGIEPDGTRGRIVKALDLPDNTGMAVQFHPELRGSEAESRIIKYVSTGWKMKGRYSPKSIVECMERQLESLMPASAAAGAAP